MSDILVVFGNEWLFLLFMFYSFELRCIIFKAWQLFTPFIRLIPRGVTTRLALLMFRSRCMSSILILALILIGSSRAKVTLKSQSLQADDPLLIVTPLGPVYGKYNNPLFPYHANPETNPRAFRGIPFAKPPVDELRFAPPEPIPAWSNATAKTWKGKKQVNVLDAQGFGPACPQAYPSPK